MAQEVGSVTHIYEHISQLVTFMYTYHQGGLAA